MKKRRRFNKLRELGKHKWYRQNIMVFLLCLAIISSLTIGYAALSQNLNIEGRVIVRADLDARITDIRINQEATTCGYEQFQPNFTTDTFTTNLVLPQLDCIIVYTLTFRNRSAFYIEITDIIEELFNNSNMMFEFSNLEIGDIIYPNQTRTTGITFKYRPGVTELPSQTNLGAIIRLTWIEHQTRPGSGGTFPGGTVLDFVYTGDIQTVTIPENCRINLEVWGAQGGGAHGGRGGYAMGELTLIERTDLTIMVGGQGAGPAQAAPGGFNGGGRGGNHSASNLSGGGGGATDIRAISDTLNHRIIVAGGGGGAGSNHGTNSSNDAGGAGGGLSGIDGRSGAGASGPTWSGFGGTQTTGGNVGSTAGPLTQRGTFGVGGSNMDTRTGGGGGGGWFGGGAAPWGGAGGGSGYVKTNTSHRPAGYTWGTGNNTFSMVNTQLIAGSASMPNPTGGNMVGNAGNGFARITRID